MATSKITNATFNQAWTSVHDEIRLQLIEEGMSWEDTEAEADQRLANASYRMLQD